MTTKNDEALMHDWGWMGSSPIETWTIAPRPVVGAAASSIHKRRSGRGRPLVCVCECVGDGNKDWKKICIASVATVSTNEDWRLYNS